MHKSLGNSISPDEIIKKYGADLVRLWVASSDYSVDVRCSDNIFKQLSEAYRKIRNTARIMLANLGNFNPDTDSVKVEDMLEIDRWALSRLNTLISTCREGYDAYEFHTVYHAINNFCTIDMSKLYIDITKDRVYVEKADSFERRSAQTALYLIINAMTRLVAPLLSFTGEEIWQAMPHSAADNKVSVFLNLLPEVNPAYSFDKADKWEKLFDLRDDVMKALETARASKLIGKSLDAKVTVFTESPDALDHLGKFTDTELATVFITSGAKVVNAAAPENALKSEFGNPIAVLVENADGRKCDRCWCYSCEGEETEDSGFICRRCRRIIGNF